MAEPATALPSPQLTAHLDSVRLIAIAAARRLRIIGIMEQRITHACGHEQAHYLTGFASQQDRKAKWLTTTKCRPCFVADKRAAQTEAASRDGAAIAHLDLPPLLGSERQVAWASSIRAGRLAALVAEAGTAGSETWKPCLAMTDAKWWIDHRDLADTDLLAKTHCQQVGTDSVAAEGTPPSVHQQAA